MTKNDLYIIIAVYNLKGLNCMKLTDELQKKQFSLSFEVFPPKTDALYDSVRDAAKKIAALSPTFMSVTYGAGGGTSEYTLNLARDIKDTFHVPSIAHLTCISSTKETVRSKIRSFTEAGIENIMALRGDIPTGMDINDSTRDYHHAVDLIADIRSISPEMCIGGACYPEKHPESTDSKEDIRYLKEKVDAGCDFLVTQMFFDNNLLYNFLYRIREVGITVPVVAGVMPITAANQITRAVELSGSFIPRRFSSLLDIFGKYPDAMKKAGIAYATDQIIDLFANGITHVHVYSMNKPDVAAQIIANLTDILGKKL